MKKSSKYSLLNTLRNIKSKRNNNLAMFNFVKADIIEAIDLGYSSKDIWQGLRTDKKFLASYPTFLKYVNKLLITETEQVLVSVNQNIDGNEQDLEQIKYLTEQLKYLLERTKTEQNQQIHNDSELDKAPKASVQENPSESQQLTAPLNTKPVSYKERKQRLAQNQKKLPPLDGTAFKLRQYTKEELI